MFKQISNRLKNSSFLNYLLPVNVNWHVLFIYRASNFLYRSKVPLIPHFLYWLNYVLFSCEIHYKSSIGKRFKISHSVGVVIGSKVKIGNDCNIYSGVVLGARGNSRKMPNIGDNVIIGTGAKVLGDINIGSFSRIGANVVVVKNLSPESIMVSKCTEL